MKKYIYITADTNDGDYIFQKKEISDEKFIEIVPVINAIKAYNDDETIKRQKYNWWAINYGSDRSNPSPTELYVESGAVTEEQLEAFRYYIPYAEYGIHTIEKISLIEVANEVELL